MANDIEDTANGPPGRGRAFKEVMRPWLGRLLVGVPFVAGSYQFACDQFDAPKLPALFNMSGAIMPWWGWLLIAQAGFVYALFEYVRRTQVPAMPRTYDDSEIRAELRALSDRFTDLERAEKARAALVDPESYNKAWEEAEAEDKAPAPPPPPAYATPILTPREKEIGKDILVDLAEFMRLECRPLLKSTSWLHSTQEEFLSSLDKLPALKAQATKIVTTIQTIREERGSMLNTMCMVIDVGYFEEKASAVEGRLEEYIGHVTMRKERPDFEFKSQYLPQAAQGVRDAITAFDSAIFQLQRAITEKRNQIDG